MWIVGTTAGVPTWTAMLVGILTMVALAIVRVGVTAIVASLMVVATAAARRCPRASNVASNGRALAAIVRNVDAQRRR